MFLLIGIASTALERGALIPQGWLLLLFVLMLMPPMVMYLTVRFQSFHEFERWGSPVM